MSVWVVFFTYLLSSRKCDHIESSCCSLSILLEKLIETSKVQRIGGNFHSGNKYLGTCQVETKRKESNSSDTVKKAVHVL